MLTSSRRGALLAFAALSAAPALLVANRAAAQTTPSEGDPSGDQADYVVQTLMVGTVSLQSSQIAAEKATDPMLQEFANLEIGEQTAVASVLASTEAGRAPPELPPEEQTKLDELNGMEAGPEFDEAYLRAQVDGHNRLLEIQQTLSGETEATVEAITARLGEQAIASHLAMLSHIERQLGGTQQQGGSQPGDQQQQSDQQAQPATDQEQPSDAPEADQNSAGSADGDQQQDGADQQEQPPAGNGG